MYRAAVVSSWLLATGCADCNRDGCDALGSPAEAGPPSVAGIVASESDLITDGCQECPFGEATIELWPVAQPVADSEQAMAIVAGTPPSSSDHVEQRYRTPLEPGNYLYCVRPNCTNVAVAAEATTTVNVQLRFGPPSFFQLDSASNELVESSSFEVGF